MTDLTKEEKKALRKEKLQKFKEKVKTALPFISGAVGALVCIGSGAYVGYGAGKKKGRKEYLEGPEHKLEKGIVAYNAIYEYRMAQYEGTVKGDYAAQYVNEDTGEVKYITTSISDQKPEWWDDNDTELCDLAEVIADDIANR